MHEVKMNKDELLNIVREMRTKHEQEFTEAVEDYKKAVLVIAKNNLKLAKTADIERFVKIEGKPVKPKSHLDEYDRTIRMLELSVDTEITLDSHQFKQLVLDEWSWKEQFVMSNATYKSYA